MRVRRSETVLQWVSDPQASSLWYARLLGITPTPYEVPYFKFAEHAYLLLSQATGPLGPCILEQAPAEGLHHITRAAGGPCFPTFQ